MEHLKNIGYGLWHMGFVCAAASIFVWLGYLIVEYPVTMVPILVVFLAWLYGKTFR